MNQSKPSNAQLLRESPLFDAAYYLAGNPDVAESGMSPVQHYLREGWKEGRDPSPLFSTRGYLEAYPDIERAGINPLVHYLRKGKAEGRSPNPFEDDVSLVRESGLFDEEYYRFFLPSLPDDEDPVVHYLKKGAKQGLDPSELFSSSAYYRRNPDVAEIGRNPLIHYLRLGVAEGRLSSRGKPRRPLFDTLFANQWPGLQPLVVARIPSAAPRVTILTDSVNAASLFGGVGTAIILGIQLANELGATLRLATRHDAPDGRAIAMLEKVSGVSLDGEVELLHVPEDGSRQFTFDPREVVLTTSWWTTRATLGSTIPRDRVVYLLQEDERMFYPYGDERLLCSDTLGERGMSVVVNTRRLLDHLASTGFPHLADEGLSFEPAFPASSGRTGARDADAKRRFFFYSRPLNARNLFWRGAEAIARAVERGVIDTDRWDLYFVGRETPDMELPGDVRPQIVEGLSWQEYQDLVSTMDAALVLMDTPHPSYPPLDLARSGAAVLTNRHPGKEDLSDVSRNILMSDLPVEDLIEGLGRLVALGEDDETRASNAAGDNIARAWATTLEPTVRELALRLAGDRVR